MVISNVCIFLHATESDKKRQEKKKKAFNFEGNEEVTFKLLEKKTKKNCGLGVINKNNT